MQLLATKQKQRRLQRKSSNIFFWKIKKRNTENQQWHNDLAGLEVVWNADMWFIFWGEEMISLPDWFILVESRETGSGASDIHFFFFFKKDRKTFSHLARFNVHVVLKPPIKHRTLTCICLSWWASVVWQWKVEGCDDFPRFSRNVPYR